MRQVGEVTAVKPDAGSVIPDLAKSHCDGAEIRYAAPACTTPRKLRRWQQCAPHIRSITA